MQATHKDPQRSMNLPILKTFSENLFHVLIFKEKTQIFYSS